ncbi:carboxymuconolactone decarboxylase family protein [Nonomuraea rubra]|uniref:carboxymuconolactone decarboxylase family protein n=1 Tax=Nonomuraea rubra TaxID=46180 RepID=UPI00340193AC
MDARLDYAGNPVGARIVKHVVSASRAAHAGETSVRLSLVAAWREATVFTEAEHAALELTEQGTRIADGAGGVTDEAWAEAARHYDEEQLTALVSLIAVMNA